MNSQQQRELRGFLLRVCDVAHPDGCSEQVIVSSLAGVGISVSQVVLRSHLSYLEEKGYLRQEEIRDRASGLGRTVWYISAKGQDLLDGHIPDDPGIMVTRWE